MQHIQMFRLVWVLFFLLRNKGICTSLLDRAALMIDSYKTSEGASEAAKKEVSINMVARAINSTTADVPIGATQGSMSGLGYSQSWTISNGATGELYFDKNDKRLLGGWKCNRLILTNRRISP